MAKRGRKKKAGLREKNGRLARSKAGVLSRGERDIVLAQPHRRWAGEEARTGQHLVDELGRLYEAKLLGEPTNYKADVAQVRLWAGQRYQVLMRQFHQAMAAPMTTKSAGASLVADSFTAADAKEVELDRLGSLVTQDEEERTAQVCREMERVNRAFRPFSPDMRQTLDAVCLHNQTIGLVGIVNLRTALTVLAGLWRIEPDRSQARGWRAEAFAVDESQHEKVTA